MGPRPAFTREEEPVVPTEQVMTRLMRRPPLRSEEDYRLDYAILAALIGGIVAGLVLAVKG